MKRIGFSTFRSKADRSGGAIEAEGAGMESAKDAARRLKIRPWIALQRFSADLQDRCDNHYTEDHHLRVRLNGCSQVAPVDYRRPSEWNAVARLLRVEPRS